MKTRTTSRSPRWLATLAASALVAALPLAAVAQKDGQPPPNQPAESFTPYSGQAGKDVIWVPTPDEVVEAMLDMAQVKAGDVVVDLGSGDGKIAIAAARRGARARGIEYNPDMVGLSRRNAEKAGVTNVEFIQGDIFASDFNDADVVTMYLLPSLNQKLRPTLLKMKPGTRLASHQFTMGDWQPDEKRSIDYRDALFWIVPAQIGGTWQVNSESGPKALKLALTQTYQKLEGVASVAGQPARLDAPTVRGGDVSFAVAEADGKVWRFAGTAGHDGKMSGQVTGPDGTARPFTASRSSTEPRL